MPGSSAPGCRDGAEGEERPVEGWIPPAVRGPLQPFPVDDDRGGGPAEPRHTDETARSPDRRPADQEMPRLLDRLLAELLEDPARGPSGGALTHAHRRHQLRNDRQMSLDRA